MADKHYTLGPVFIDGIKNSNFKSLNLNLGTSKFKRRAMELAAEKIKEFYGQDTVPIRYKFYSRFNCGFKNINITREMIVEDRLILERILRERIKMRIRRLQNFVERYYRFYGPIHPARALEWVNRLVRRGKI